MKYRKRPNRFGLMLLVTFVVFCALLLNTAITSVVVYLLVRHGILAVSADSLPHLGKLILMTAVISVPVGLLIALAVSKIPLKPIRSLIDGMNRLGSGDFSARIHVGSIMKNYPAYVDMANSFNHMAEELQNTEMLRGDFINNFSHEFKTPIVSIAGFAKLLKRGNLSLEQQREYLDVIEEESLRLSYMATNVLNLTKVENQSILTDVTRYNLSEQMRGCILLLENKWSRKGLDFHLYFGEHQIYANEELLKQVWINLLDNAIKFSPDNAVIEVRIAGEGSFYSVCVLNSGCEIPPEHQEKIFHKFYQADESHAAEGNGVGLAIVKRIVQLHGGQVRVSSGDGVTAFTVELPKDGLSCSQF